MELKSKYEKGNVIHFVSENVPSSGIVVGISAFSGFIKNLDGEKLSTNSIMIYYHFEDGTKINELNAFGTKEELINYFLEIFD